MTNPTDKAKMRKQVLAMRKQAFETHGRDLAAANANLLAQIGDVSGKVIAGYMPIRSEISPLSCMAGLAGRNQICVPVIDAPAAPLRFREWHYDAEMIEGEFGAMIPATGAWLCPDIIIVPLVGFDASGNRLGYGGGFYDRTLEQLRAMKPVQAIGFAFAAQQLPSLTPEATDQPLDAIVTEQAVTHP